MVVLNIYLLRNLLLHLRILQPITQGLPFSSLELVVRLLFGPWSRSGKSLKRSLNFRCQKTLCRHANSRVSWVIKAFGRKAFLQPLIKILGANDLSPKISSRQLREKEWQAHF